MVIVGGSAFILSGYNDRATHDIDVLFAENAMARIMASYNMNGSVAAYSDCIPYNYESRLQRLNIETKSVDFFVPSLEDLVVLKLYASRPSDIDDLSSSATIAAIDWELLEKLIYDENESKASILSERRWQEMCDAYEKFKKENYDEKVDPQRVLEK
jgi:hypothetical protein